MKQCSKCGELKEVSLFSIGRNQCKECIEQWTKQYYLNNKEKIKQYRLENKEEIKQYKKQYYLDHKEERKQYDKQYRLDYKEEKKQRNKQYYLDHKEEKKQQQKQYRQSEAGKITSNKKNAKRRNIKYIPLINNPFPEDIIVEDHHILNNFHAIDAEGTWNKWFVIPIPKITHKYVGGATNGLDHWRHNEEWIRKLYCIDIKELLNGI